MRAKNWSVKREGPVHFLHKKLSPLFIFEHTVAANFIVDNYFYILESHCNNSKGKFWKE